MARYHIFVYGMVQGVGFRYFTYYTARNFDITGWVRNCPDGSVEIEAQGSEEIINEFIQRIKQGNNYSEVENISVKRLNSLKEEKSFQIR